MTHSEISDDDITVLVEALEAWEQKDFAGQIMSDIFGMMLGKDDPASKARMAEMQAQEKLKRDRATSARKERSIMLKAKLLTLRTQRGVEEIDREVRRT